ncbi:type II toxin-antitoxin system VapC family toxin [Desertifilum sp. FACHB-1129]|uniref:Twitching motility protein PilT n=2 Tax=Desertifilum tharense IPPAS B-1220 TaxID=1781255 RepID=A0A1E5QPD2_9CYAN|nr:MULTISPECIES: type II toxin-antitoxin system VapC family toxin [Desertifilum]MDA0211072.1 type II toxin-antitoxin system VapC family toxin [Cyanobacteria bacterium FC1]MBD2312676.1 type II toxin-antitoxin system VapC family toxin [Desertifilum sp. FACHB-1129]MBD2320157.1 type II toxin-antitoxin system VapC family toxin [Desertifilum sp. FACHB-866]MBD2330285.1 type II toxin-antitoxin system VapC family toxin [Desertifilum sp. FACHB-868]OEJ76474.1 twitching motility protein PilT [Desertifilum
MTTPIKCVVDASVCIKQFVPDPLSDKAQQLFAHLANPQNEIYIPDLFYIESANTLWRYVRAGQLTASQVQANLATLKALSLQVVSMAELMEEAVNIAIACGISAYDASYVALSQRVSAPLLTLDRRLVNALAIASFDVRLFTDFSVPPVP